MIPLRLLIRRPFRARQDATAEGERLRTRLAETELALASARRELERPLRRTHDLKQVYSHQVDRTTSLGPIDEAMSASIGGDFEYVGRVEVAVLKRYGLRPTDHVIDVGCGAGRLALPLSSYLTGRYCGFDVVDRLVNYARDLVGRPDWRFDTIDHIAIPEPDGQADMVCFFSVLTHLLHEQSYWYLEEARRVVKPGGTIVVSFLEFAEPDHWPIFAKLIEGAKNPDLVDPVSVFIERNALRVWADHLGLDIVDMLGGNDAVDTDLYMGQSLCILRRPGGG